MYDGLPVHAYNVKRAADLRTRLFDRYKVARVEDLPVNFRGVDYLEREAHANDIWDAHYNRAVDGIRTRSDRCISSPGWRRRLMAVRALSMALTGTDSYHHQAFRDGCRGLSPSAGARDEQRPGVRRLVAEARRVRRGSVAVVLDSAVRVSTAGPRRWSLSQVRTSAVALFGWVVGSRRGAPCLGAPDGGRMSPTGSLAHVVRHELRLVARSRAAWVVVQRS